MSYKKLGDYIVEKDEFNVGNKFKLLQGVSNRKYFQKAKTNTIGIDLSKYRVAHHNQFVFNRATTRNSDKISIALRKGKSCIVSPSYRVFEVKDENVLNPDYLLMWFSRPEFDRYARFKSHGSAHEFFDIGEMKEVELPIPSIEEQRHIVSQYQSITNKIKVNEQICEKLEATAQALYRHWFVDFEFPHSPPLEGCPQDGVVNSHSLEGCPQDGVVISRNTQNYMALPYNPALKDRAKALRKAGNLAEVLFWQQVRNKQFKGLDFDRQKIVGNYIVDFYNANFQVVIEIDGSSHDDKQEYDAARDAYLESLGLVVIHITDRQVKKEIDSVMRYLEDHPAFQRKVQEAETDHPAFQAPLQGEEKNYPELRPPLQGRGTLGYKSSGGAVVWNEELDREIPEGWEIKEVSEFGKVITGKTPSSSFPEDFGEDYQFITPGDFVNEKIIIDSNRKLSQTGWRKLVNKINPKHSVLITCIGSDMGKVSLNYKECITNQQINSIVGFRSYYSEYLYFKLVEIKDVLKSIAVGGSTMPMLSKSSFEEIKLLKPNDAILELFYDEVIVFTEQTSVIQRQNLKLSQLQSLLLSRLATFNEVKQLTKKLL